MTRDELIAFETEIAALFNAGQIPHPVHLSDGNEDQLIAIFEDIEPHDWVLGSWRMHYQALLHGVPRETLKRAICEGHSMALHFPEYRVYGSAIAGGGVPIALGAAMAIRRQGGPERVWCFVGDMVALSGIFHECSTYAANHDLPIAWIVEDNGVSVCTPTAAVWGETKEPHVVRYRYASKYPHAGAGTRVQF